MTAGLRSSARRTWRSFKALVKGNPRLRKGYLRLKGRYHRARLRGIGANSTESSGVNPANVVWIFCTSRSGSTWLRSMMEELAPGETWEEPGVARLFGDFYEKAPEEQLDSTDFILGEPTRESWISSIRSFVLDAARACNPSLRPDQYLLVKEPDGATGAPLIMEALPESRMVLLVRDPRDVASSALDATEKGAWMYETTGKARRKGRPERKPDNFVRKRSESYLRQITSAKRAYDAHEGPKALIRYEDLRADTLGTMKRMYSSLEIPVDEERLVRVVEKHSWRNVPAGEKGRGKFYRKAKPGGWREDLTPEQARMVEEITAPLLREFYP